jgi:ATP-dependent Clp protease, protease subunit
MVFGQITDKLARDVVSRVLALVDESAKPIQIYVNSPGGHVESGDSIHDIIKFVRSTVPIYMIGTGWVASRAHQDARAIGPNHRHRDRTVRRTSPQGHWNYWMSASEAIDYGVANEIISSIKDLK